MKAFSSAVFATLLVLLAGSAPAQDKCGPEPRLPLSMHKAMYEAHKLLEKNDQKGALAKLTAFADTHKESRHFRFSFMRGVLHYQLKDVAGAARFFGESVELRPCHSPALRNLAAIRYEQGQPLQAAELALEAYRYASPPQPELLYEASVFYLTGNQPAKAVPLLENLSQNPNPAKTWLTALARTYMELNQQAKAEPVVARLLELEPGDEMLWRLLASLQLSLKRHAKAAAALEVAYRLKPPNAAGLRDLAGLFQAAGLPLKAARLYRQAFGPKPTAREMDRLTEIYLHGNYPQLALETASEAARLEPSSQRLSTMGRIHLRQKNYSKAYEYFTRAARLGDSKGDISLMAGYCAMQMEKLDEACTAFGKAIKKAPKDSNTAKEALHALEAMRNYIQALKEAEIIG